MIVTTDLRLAIKAAEKTQKHNSGYHNQHALKAADAAYARGSKLRNQLSVKYGIEDCQGKPRVDYYRADAIEAFRKAGGKYKEPSAPWKSDAIIAELAAAAPKKAQAILKRVGIIWK